MSFHTCSSPSMFHTWYAALRLHPQSSQMEDRVYPRRLYVGVRVLDTKFPKQEYRLDRVMLLFKEDWPLAEIDFVKRDEASLGRGFPSVRLVFAKGSESDAPRTGLAEMLPAVAINGGVIMLISDLLEVQDG